MDSSAGLTAAAQHDPEGVMLEELARRLYGPVRRWARRWTDTADDAEDVAQDAMLKLITCFDSFRGQGQIESWMYRVTRNSALSSLRRKSTRKRLEARSQVPEQLEMREDTLERVAGEDLVARIAMLSECLSPKRRRAFRMVHLEGLTAVDTARRLGLAPASVRSLIHRARGEIRRSLQACPGGEDAAAS